MAGFLRGELHLQDHDRRQLCARGWKPAIIFANSRGMLQDRVSALREANIYERQSYRHILGQPWISRTRAATRCAARPRFWSRASCRTATPIFTRPAATSIVYRIERRPKARRAYRRLRQLAHRHADGVAAMSTPTDRADDRRSQRHRPGDRRQGGAAAARDGGHPRSSWSATSFVVRSLRRTLCAPTCHFTRFDGSTPRDGCCISSGRLPCRAAAFRPGTPSRAAGERRSPMSTRRSGWCDEGHA